MKVDYSKILKELADIIKNRGRTEAFVESFNLVMKILGNSDPYKYIKEKYNKVAQSITESIDFTKFSCKELLAIMASSNNVDIEMPGYTPSIEKFIEAINIKETVFKTPSNKICSLIKNAHTIALVLDNAGEAIIDIKAASTLSRNKELIIIAKERPYEIDVTTEDVYKFIPKNLKLTIVSTRHNYPAFHPSSYHALNVLLNSDVILVKGIGNLEAFLENPVMQIAHKTIFLLRAKCNPIADILSTDVGSSIVICGDTLLRIIRRTLKYPSVT